MSDPRFTTEEAYEASEAGAPIMISAAFARELCEKHAGVWAEFLVDMSDQTGRNYPRAGAAHYDAADVIGWLGY